MLAALTVYPEVSHNGNQWSHAFQGDRMQKLLWFFMLLMFLLTACNLAQPALPTPNPENIIFVTATNALPTANAEGVIVVTATPNPVVFVTETPVPTTVPAVLPPTDTTISSGTNALALATDVSVLPTAGSVPTLATSPQDALAQAAQLRLNGYYEQAVQIYQALLGQGENVETAIRAEAAFYLGQTALREGLFTEAIPALTLLIDQFSQDAWAAQAYFLRGDAYLGLSQWQAAITDFQQYLALRPGLIDSYAHERIADAQLALGQTNEALVSYDLALQANRTVVPLLVLREKVAKILLSVGRLEDAIAQYDAILVLAKNVPYRASVEYMAARALLDNGFNEPGLSRARRVFDNYSETPSAYLAMQALLQGGVPIDGFKRGKTSFFYGDYNGAIEAFNQFSSTTLLADIPAELYLLLGRAYREIGSTAAAEVAFQTIIEQYPTDPLFGDALLEQGRTRFLAGDIPAAITRYIAIADSYGYLQRTAAEALWRAGYLYGTNNDPVRSREIFLRMAQEFPNDEWTMNGLFLAASAAVTSQEWAIAENLYGRLATLATGTDQAAAYLWTARLAQQRGDTASAQAALGLAIAAAPDSYFAARAQDIQLGRIPFQPPAQVQFDFDEAAGQAESEAWLRTTFAIEQPGNLSQLSPALENDPRIIRGRELWAVSARTEALDEFADLLDEKRTAGDALASYQLAIFLRDQGAYLSSIVAAADVIIASKQNTLEVPAYIARMRYPAYYANLVTTEAEKYGFDPLLLLALIRQESLYNAEAVSSAGARGLTQVMPATGQDIANRLGVTDWQVSDLFRPYTGIMFGAFYIDEQLRRFERNAAATLAAYNAGPGRALDWYKLSGGDVDLMMTTITITETRTYLQRIYSHYTIYRELYGVTPS